MSNEITKDFSHPSEDYNNNEDQDDNSEVGDRSEGDLDSCDASDDETHSGDETSDEDNVDRQSDENSNDSLDGTLDKCPICLRVFREQEIGTPDSCEHSFCLNCILEWAENVSTCPIDRKSFHSVLVMDKVKGQVLRVRDIAPRAAQLNAEYDDFSDPCFCEVCGRCDREDRLLLCDECDMGYHLECLDPPLEAVPVEDWYCPTCAVARIQNDPGPSTPRVRPSGNRIPRTGLSRRIMIRRRRDTSGSNSWKHGKPQTGEVPAGNRGKQPASRSESKRPRTRRRKRKSQTHRLTNGKRKQRGRKKRTKKQRVAMERRPATSRGRLVQQLGILPPRPGQVYSGLPTCRASLLSKSVLPTSSTAIRTQRHQAGIAPLRMYATVNDLADYFEGSSDEEGGVGVMRPQPIRIGDSRKRVLASANAQQASSINVLGPILSRQHILLQDKNMRIQCGDGKLVPSISVNPDKLLCSPANENDSSGYDSFPNRGSPPRFRSHGGGGTNSSGGNNSTTSRETRNFSSSTQSSNTTEMSSSYNTARVGTSAAIFPYNTPSSLGGYNSNEATNTFEDFSGFDDNIDRTRKLENSKEKDEDDDDEYNIYSDIEVFDTDEARPFGLLSFDLPIDLPESSALDGCAGESDTDMVIDEEEAAAGIGPGERESRSSLESIALPASDFPLNFGEGDVMSRDGSPALPEVEQDSPLSIPLPDSTPPPSVRDIPNPEDEDTEDLSFDEMQKEEEVPIREKRDEYDPSHPLTSSEDEEGVPLPEVTPIPATTTITIMDTEILPPPKPKPSGSSLDISSIPMPSEEYRRPTIQFSIPSRHRIFSIGSLIRRNKGVMKKEAKAGSSISFQSEMSKAFVRKGEESRTSGVAETEKVSLVAEIFGSDEDEEETFGPKLSKLTKEDLEDLPTASLQTRSSEVQVTDALPIVESTTEGLEGSKWRKIVEDEPIVISTSPTQQSTVPAQLAEDDDVVLIEDTPPEVQIIETPPPEPEDVPREVRPRDRSRPLNESPRAKTPDKSMTRHRKESKDTPSPKKAKRNSNTGIFDSVSDTENESERQRQREKRLVTPLKKSDEERKRSRSKSPKKDKENKRSHKQRLSPSPQSNCEEGEILDIPEKKKKKSKKAKKPKKRRRSARSRSSSSSEVASFIEKKIPEDTHVQVTSEEENEEKSVCWKKPSKSTKERNYRDGKPKTEEKYFRERDKKLDDKRKSREKSPVPQRSRDVDENRSRSNRRISQRRRTDSRHSNRNSSSPKKFKSRSRSRQSRSVRHERRPREHSLSPIRRIISPDRTRSRRTSYRSRSPVKRQWSRRRSRSNKPKRFKLRSQSISRSRSNSPRSRRKKKEKDPPPSPLLDRSSPKKARRETKEVEEPKETEEVHVPLPESTQAQGKEKSNTAGGDKEKRKKKKRREKSISPAKAIFADGDSIVVSLNFQKGKDTTTTSVDKESTISEVKTPDSAEKKKITQNDSSTTERSDGKPKTLKKTILIDLECSPIQEEPIGDSPTLIVLSDDEEGHEKSRTHDSELAVSTTSVGDVGKSPIYRESHGVPADSTQIQLSSTEVIPKGNEYGHGRTSISESETGNTPARGDALVSSTRDSVDRNGVQDEYMMSPFTPPKDSSSSPNDMSMTPPLPPGTPPPFTPSTPELQPPKQPKNLHPSTTHSIPMVNLPPVSNSSLVTRPLGIVNIPGLFTPTKVVNMTQVTHLPPVMPVVIPAPQQLRLPPPNLFNQSVLATVANALYGPLMASGPRFGISQPPPGPTNNPNPNTSRIGTNVIGKKTSGGSVLLPKDQNYGSHRHNEGGDSPFSPNSSDGDDLFEPPKDSSHQNSNKTPTGVSSGHRVEKGAPDAHGTESTNMKTKGRAALHIYDSLFGGQSKKQAGTAGPAQGKAEKSKSKSGHKSKARRSGHKKAAKLVEGELRLAEEVPTSAVELRVKEKFLKKLNRQERVVEEVKVSLKPHYSKKHITKEEYKDILRRAVPKICHNKTGEINPIKIKELVEAYVKKVRKTRKK